MGTEVVPEADKRLKRLGKRLKPKGIDLRPEGYSWSVIQALLSRSDRRLAPVIVAVRGTQESLGGWKKAYRAARAGELPAAKSAGVELPLPPAWEQVIHETWPDDTVLPWSHLQGPLSPRTPCSSISNRHCALNRLRTWTEQGP